LNPPEFWWCCLNPRERNLLMLMLPFFSFAGAYFLKSAWDTYWLTQGLTSASELAEWFEIVYDLTEGTISPDGETVTEVLFFGMTFWPAFYAFSLTDDFICTEECLYLRFDRS